MYHSNNCVRKVNTPFQVLNMPQKYTFLTIWHIRFIKKIRKYLGIYPFCFIEDSIYAYFGTHWKIRCTLTPLSKSQLTP